MHRQEIMVFSLAAPLRLTTAAPRRCGGNGLLFTGTASRCTGARRRPKTEHENGSHQCRPAARGTTSEATDAGAVPSVYRGERATRERSRRRWCRRREHNQHQREHNQHKSEPDQHQRGHIHHQREDKRQRLFGGIINNTRRRPCFGEKEVCNNECCSNTMRW